MLSADIIKSLKQKNVSVNAELTTQRAKDALKKAKRAQKNEIDALTGLKRVSINRVYSTGSISAKVAIAMAQTLNIDPFYLTGESDEKGSCTDKQINAFLIAKGYAGSAVSKTPKAKEASAPVSAEYVSDGESADEASFVEMTEDEAVHLLRSLFIQARYSAVSKELLEQVKAMLT